MQYVFLLYLIVWSFVVAGALISACGLAAHALSPVLSVEAWGVLHSVVAAALVVFGGYRSFEKLIGLFIGLMFVSLIGTSLMVQSPGTTLMQIVTEAALPSGSGRYILAVMVLAASVLFGGPEIQGNRGVLTMAGMLGPVVGPIGRWTFLVGFWGAVATSMLGVWQGVPYLFCDFVGLMRRLPQDEQRAALSTRSPWYRLYLFWLAGPPIVLLLFGRPVGLIVLYSVMSALFMPFLAATLLFLNSRRELVGERLRNGWGAKLALLLCLGLFAYLGVRKLGELFF